MKRPAVILSILIIFAVIIASSLLWKDESVPSFQSGPDTGASSSGTAQTAPDASSTTQTVQIPEAFKDRLVIIDPGHGGADSGTEGPNGPAEKNVTLAIGLKLDTLLKAAGVNTYMTRSTDDFMKPQERSEAANSRDADLYVSIHCDAFEDDTSVDGTTTLYHPTRKLATGNLDETQFATIIQQAVIKAAGTRDRGILPRSNLYVLNTCKMPSLIVEMGYVSNPGDAAKLSDPDFQQKAAEGLADGIMQSLNAISASPSTTEGQNQ